MLRIFLAIQVFSNQESQKIETRQSFYFTSAAFYVGALVTSNLALQYISYPSQVIGKGKKKK